MGDMEFNDLPGNSQAQNRRKYEIHSMTWHKSQHPDCDCKSWAAVTLLLTQALNLYFWLAINITLILSYLKVLS